MTAWNELLEACVMCVLGLLSEPEIYAMSVVLKKDSEEVAVIVL